MTGPNKTRDRKMLRLSTHVWIAGMLNAFLLADQLRVLLTTRHVEGLSLFMWVGFIYMQAVMSAAGYRTKLWGQAIGLGISAAISTTIVCLILLWR